MVKRLVLALLLGIVLFGLYGCQTIEGLGGDVKWSGEQMQAGAGNFTK